MLASVGLTLLAVHHLEVPAFPPLAAAVRGLYAFAAWFGKRTASSSSQRCR